MTRAKNPLSRRNLLGLVSTASLGPGLLSADAAAQPRPPQDNGKSRSGARTFNIRDFGAKGDGQTLDTQAVQAAIDACSNDKGGRVLVPAGTFLIGTVEMKSNVTLHISAEGTLMGSTHSGDYHPADRIPLKGDTTLRDGNVAMIYAVDAEDITIEGPGIIDGQGVQFPSLRRHLPPKFASGGEDRPHHLLFYRCKNVRIRDVFLFACAYQSVRIIQSRYVWCDGIRIYSRVNRNNDGFHFVSCEDVHVSNCDVRCQDDACAMFGSCRNITVTNCAFSTRWAVFRFGGGNPANITISNCVVYETYGCPIKMQFGPESQAQNILFSNIVMDNVTGPISIGLRRRSDRTAFATGAYFPSARTAS